MEEIRENNGNKRIYFFYDSKTFHGKQTWRSLNVKSALRYKQWRYAGLGEILSVGILSAVTSKRIQADEHCGPQNV
jgi:hypothetical protein